MNDNYEDYLNRYVTFGPVTLNLPEYSDWKCEMFGMGVDGIVFTPRKGCEPNRFWRWMQFLFFGNRWVRVK